ncbi:MAG: iron ABC transporter permease [Syntrophaceae bacterium]|nr:iron ABC transporter permease [Syntrophaceae bacterium]
MILLSFLLAGVMGVSVSLGAVTISLAKSWSILGHHLLGLSGVGKWTASESSIILDLRLPRILSGALVGSALAMAGAVLQALLRNPLADPFVLGISSGAAVGAVLAILFGLGATFLGAYAIPGSAFGGALFTLFLVYFIARTEGRAPTNTMLLAGVIVSSFFSAVIMFLISATSDEQIYNVTFWLMGNLEYMASQPLWIVFFFLIVGGGILLSLARDFNLLSLGEETASELGVDVERVKKTAFIFASLITGAVVSVSGLIGFVGLIVPHVVRMVWGPDHRFLLPASALVGAMLMVVADTLARTVMAPTEIPVGVVTAMGGAPFFVYLLRKKGHAVYR